MNNEHTAINIAAIGGDSRLHPGRLIQANRNAIPKGEIQVWRVDLASFEGWSGFQGVLSGDERVRADNFRFDTDRLRFELRRGILRYLIGSYLGAMPGDIRFQYGLQGKPRLASESTPPDFQFNLSYSGDRVLYAFTMGREVGIDIEQVRPIPELEHLAKRHFSSIELAAVRRSRGLHDFLGVWTRKEAVIKALGVGLAQPLKAFSVEPTWGFERNGYQVSGDIENSTRWRVLQLDAGRDFIGAICTEGTGFSLTTRTLADRMGIRAI